MEGERQPLIPQPSTSDRSRWGIRCLLAVAFLQSFGIGGTVFLALIDLIDRFTAILKENYTQPSIVLVGFFYVVPVIAGIYADVYAGRYRTLFFGMTIKMLGNFLLFVTMLIRESVVGLTEKEIECLYVMYFISIALIASGLSLTLVINTFTTQQTEAGPENVSKIFRWLFFMVALGLGTEGAISNIPSLYYLYWNGYKTRYYSTVRHAIITTADVLSIVIFLLGKSRYTIATVDEGRKSWGELVRIIKTRVLCMKPPSTDSLWSFDRDALELERKRRHLDRLKLKKCIIIIPLLSCVGITQSLVYLMDAVTVLCEDSDIPPWRIRLLRNAKFGVYMVALPVFEYLLRRSGYQIRQASVAGHLITMGVGCVVAAIASLLSGITTAVMYKDNFENVSIFCILPQFFVLGLAMLLIYPSVFTLVYLESLPALESLPVAIALCLSILMVAVRMLYIFFDLKVYIRFDTSCFFMSGLVLFWTCFAYIPSSVWYLKTTRSIEEFQANQSDTSETQTEDTTNTQPEPLVEDAQNSLPLYVTTRTFQETTTSQISTLSIN